MSKEKEYKFDVKLISENIRFIDRDVISRFGTSVRCERCNANLKRIVVTLRIDTEFYQIGDFCYNSIKKILSEKRGKSLVMIAHEIEEKYNKFLEKKWSKEILEPIIDGNKVNKWHRDYSRYQELKWDNEHGNLPKIRKEEFEKLSQQFESIKKVE